MKINPKIVIPFTIVVLTIVIASWTYYYGKSPKGPGWFSKDSHSHAEDSSAPLYTCPMHPFIIKDKPGSCPICGMELVKKLGDAQQAAVQTSEQQRQMEQLGQVALSTTQRIMANVATSEATVQPLSKEINAVGVVQYDQSRQAKVTAWVAGRIDRLNVSTIGSMVSKDNPVAEIYSPDLLSTQQEYLLAIKSREQLKDSPVPSIARSGDGLVNAAKQRLMLYGVKDHQIAELERAGKPNIRLPIYTPLSGVVIEKLVQEGQYLNVGDVLFNIADLSKVWVEIEVYENEVQNIMIGQAVEISSPSFPGRHLTGRVAFIYPFMDPKTRTVKARVEMPNPGMKLKPDMFVNAIIKIGLGKTIVLPVSSVLDSGKSQVVWVEKKPGIFEPRHIQVGQRTDDKIQILSGIKPGEKVAVSGAYLIDSESQLRGGDQNHSQHTGATPDAKGSTTAPKHGQQDHATPTPQPAKAAPSGKKLNLDDMKM